jgi:hypothetical protein
MTPLQREAAYIVSRALEALTVLEAHQLERNIDRPSLATLTETKHLVSERDRVAAVRASELARMRAGIHKPDHTREQARTSLPERLRSPERAIEHDRGPSIGY